MLFHAVPHYSTLFHAVLHCSTLLHALAEFVLIALKQWCSRWTEPQDRLESLKHRLPGPTLRVSDAGGLGRPENLYF